MHRASYLREVGIDAGERVIPLPYVLALFAVLAVVAWLGAGALQSRIDQRQEAERHGGAPEVPAHAGLVRK